MTIRGKMLAWRLPAVLVITVGICGAVLILIIDEIPAAQSPGGRDNVEEATTERAPDARVFTTWRPLELDKCVSAWLLRRFVDDRAAIRFESKDLRELKGTPFDIPGAAWSRQPSKCTTEVILESTGIKDPALERIASFARKAELGRWQLDEFPEARKHYYAVRAIINSYPDPYEAFSRVAAYLDQLYAQLSAAPAHADTTVMTAPAVTHSSD